MANNFQNVVTYNKTALGLMQNGFAFIDTSNKQFLNFNDQKAANLGASVSFRLFNKFTSSQSLTPNFSQGVEDRVQTLTADQAFSVGYNFTAEEFILNAKQWKSEYGEGAILELGTDIETYIASIIPSNTYRFFDGITAPLSTSNDLSTALAFFRDGSAVMQKTKGYLDYFTTSRVTNSNLNQFVPIRNEKQAYDYEVGRMNKTNWYQSNLLPIHTAGNEGELGTTLTVVSVVKNADDAVTSIVFSGTANTSDPDSIKENDKGQFLDIGGGVPNLRARTIVGHKVSGNTVQFRAIADAASDGSNEVTVSVFPPLKASAGRNQSINTEIVAGMQVKFLPSHRCGLITSGDPLYMAMPRLPSMEPYPSSVMTDPLSGASIRTYYGPEIFSNKYGMAHDCFLGRTLVDENAMLVALPL